MAIDVEAASVAITETISAIGMVGGAVLILHVGIRAWHWIRQALLDPNDPDNYDHDPFGDPLDD